MGIKDLIKFISGKLLLAIFFGFTIGFMSKTLKQDSRLRKLKKRTFNKNNRIILRANEKITREDIVKMGKTAIRCKNTNEILVDPLVDLNGISYEKDINNWDGNYNNRLLKEFIFVYRKLYDKSQI